MQFDMIHCSTEATLWEPRFVLASVIWAAFLAYMWDQAWRGGWSRWRALALSALLTRIAVPILAGLVEIPLTNSCVVIGRGLWMAIPLAALFVGFRLALPRVNRIAIAARVVALLMCLHACWTVTLFRMDVARWIGPESLVGLEDKVAHAPWVAFLGVASMLLLYVLVERRASEGGWRRRIAVRLQLLLALGALVAELRIASLPMVFEGVPAGWMMSPLVALSVGFVAQGWRGLR